MVAAYNDYHTKLLTMIAGGAAPDVMRIDSYYFADFMKVNALKEIGSLAKRDSFDLSSYYQHGIEECTNNNKLFGLPWGTAPFYMFVNLDVLEKAGVALPSFDWTMDDCDRIARAFSKGSGADKVYGLSISLTNVASILPFVWANGGDLLDAGKKNFILDKPAAAQAIQRLVKMYNEGVMPPEFISGVSDNGRLFINNKVAMAPGTA